MKEDLQTAHYNDSKSMPLRKALGDGEGYLKWAGTNSHFTTARPSLPGNWLRWIGDCQQKRLEQTERIHRRECFRIEKGRYLELDVYSATNETGFCIQPAGLLLERENKTALVNANSSTAYWLYDGTQSNWTKS